MKFNLAIILLFWVFQACNRPAPTYLEATEYAIDKIIEDSLVCDGEYFYDDLESYFEGFVIKSGYWLEWNDGKENLYYSYLESIQPNGGGLGALEDEKFKELRQKVECAGHLMEQGNYLGAIYNWVKPTIDRYETRLIKEGSDDDVLFHIAKCDPHEGAISLTAMTEGLLKKYKKEDFKRPFLKKYVILFWFMGFG